MEKNLSNDEAIKKMKELADSVNVCMYTSLNADKQMNSRPMGTAKVEESGIFWFFTSDYSGAAHQAAAEMDVCITYASPAKNSYLSVNGTAELVHEKSKMEELWTPILKAWFPDGLETPDIALLKVTPISGHYWDGDASRIRILYTYLLATVTGKRPQGTEGDDGELKIGA